MTAIPPDQTFADAMLGAQPGDAPAAGAVVPHRFGATPVRTGLRLAGLERLGDRLARRARTAIEPLARCKTQVTAAALVTERFDGYVAELPAYTALNVYRMRPLKGSMMIVLEPGFVSMLVDSFYGGSGARVGVLAREFTATEERIAGRLADQLALILGECWTEVTPLQLQITARETNPVYASMVRADETVIVQRLEVTPASGGASHIDMIYPQAALRPVEALLATRGTEDVAPRDTVWRERLGDALSQVRLPVRSVLARPEITVGQLVALKTGDIIPISLANHVPLTIAGKPLARGTIGESDGRAAMIVEEIGGRDL